MIQGRVLLLGDVNTHSPVWNLYCQRKQNAKSLKDLIEKFDLLINNKLGRIIKSVSAGVSIIDLVLLIIELSFLTL